jgi:hypothetical protein
VIACLSNSKLGHEPKCAHGPYGPMGPCAHGPIVPMGPWAHGPNLHAALMGSCAHGPMGPSEPMGNIARVVGISNTRSVLAQVIKKQHVLHSFTHEPMGPLGPCDHWTMGPCAQCTPGPYGIMSPWVHELIKYIYSNTNTNLVMVERRVAGRRPVVILLLHHSVYESLRHRSSRDRRLRAP